MSPALSTGMGPRLSEAIDLFNRRDYFASQERFEEVLRDSDAGDRPFVEALVQLSVALHIHFNRGGGRGTKNLLQQCLVRLDDHRPARLGVDVQTLCDEVTVYLEDLGAGDVRGPRLLERWRVPKIRTLGGS